MKTNMMVLALTIITTCFGYASESIEQTEVEPEDRNFKILTEQEATCVKEAKQMASRILNKKKIEKISNIEAFEAFNSNGMEYEKNEVYAFGNGESGLAITMLPDYQNDGKCEFDSAQVWRD